MPATTQAGTNRLGDRIRQNPPRRWNKVGIFRTTLINQLTVAAFHFGVSPQRLAVWYVSWLNRDAL